MGEAHARAYQHQENVEIAAVTDLQPSALTTFTETFDISATYDDYADMLDDESLDLISICTFHSTHARMTIDAVESGVDGIYCEKPMSTNLGEAEDMVDAAERNDVKLTIGHQRRFHPVQERARKLIADGEIGEPKLINGEMGSGLLNWGAHMVDMARFLLGDPEYEWMMAQVERKTDRYERGEPAEDRCLGRICFEDGTRFTYEGDMLNPKIDDESHIVVTGSDGVLQIQLDSWVSVTNEDGTTRYEPESGGRERMAYVNELIEWIEGDRDGHRCSGEEGRQTMELLMSFYESVRTSGLVRAPLETRANPLKLMIEDGSLPVEYPGKYDIRIPYSSVHED